jgi:hypothetical protein
MQFHEAFAKFETIRRPETAPGPEKPLKNRAFPPDPAPIGKPCAIEPETGRFFEGVMLAIFFGSAIYVGVFAWLSAS